MINLSQRRSSLLLSEGFEKDTHIDLVLPHLKAKSLKSAMQNISVALGQHLKSDPAPIYSMFNDSDMQSSSLMDNGCAIIQGKAKQSKAKQSKSVVPSSYITGNAEF
jgi:hypothetical protein